MNPLLRTVHAVIEHNINQRSVDTFLHSNGIKAFALVKRVTGTPNNDARDYSVESVDNWHGYDSIVLSGALGFIRVALQPLFEVVE